MNVERRRDVGSERGLIDLAARRQVFGTGEHLRVPVDGLGFWTWYAHFVRLDPELVIGVNPSAPPYPAADAGPALWYSGGVESTYTRALLADENVTLLSIEEFDVFYGPDRAIGQIHFLCAVLASSYGYGPIYMGMERNDLLLGWTVQMRSYVERHPVFAEAWTAYQPDHPLITLCADLHKEEIIKWLADRSIAITGTCDRMRGGEWCGDCYKCFEAYYSAKAVGVTLPVSLRATAFDRYYAEYRRYVESDFTDNFNNAYQHYVRLQITYGLEFDRHRDCPDG
jgi:hypothetical protein